MSSGSEDEDQLLYMALKEQAQCNVNYQRPPSSGTASGRRKPVENFVQPPKATSQKSAANQQQQQKNRRAVEEDEESEVEMLSISSGDEEVSKDRESARGRGSRGGGGDRDEVEDDRVWDGEKPAYWKHMNEAECPHFGIKRVFDHRTFFTFKG